MTRMRIAMVSEHASPLATLGGVDAGGQNTHVAELATALAKRGHEVRVYTRRDDPQLPTVVPFGERVSVEHVPAGPASTWSTVTPGASRTRRARSASSRRVCTVTACPSAPSSVASAATCTF